MLAGYDDSDGWRALFGPDDEVADPCDLYVRQSQWQRVVQGIETHLTDRQRFVLAKRFGMADDDREEHVREDIGRMMNLSRERVRGIETEALTRLRDRSDAEAWDASLYAEHSTFEELVGWYAADFTEAYFCGIFRGSEVWVAQAEEGDYVCVWGHYRWFYFETRPWLFVQGDSLWALRFHPDTQTFRSELVTS